MQLYFAFSSRHTQLQTPHYLLNVLSSLFQNCFQIFPQENFRGAQGVAVALVATGVAVQDHPADLLGGGPPWDPALQETPVPEKPMEQFALKNVNNNLNTNIYPY